VCGLIGAGLRRLGQLFQAPPRPSADRGRNRLADLMPLEDRRLPSAVPLGAGLVPLGAEFRVNTFTQGQQTLSAQTRQAVATDAAGDFVIVWSSQGQDGDGWGVYAQRYDAAGNPQGSEFRVNTTTQGDQNNSAVAMDAAGNFVVACQNQNGDWGIYAQRYNAAGVAQGGEFRVNTTTNDDQMNPAVAVGPSGSFLVTWQSHNQDGSGWGIYAQRYSAAGVAQGGEFRVNTTTNQNQQDPAVAADGRGDYLVAWQSGSGSGWDIYAQRYDASGNRLGGEFLVNTTTAGNQPAPAVAADAAGDFLIAWQSQSPGGRWSSHTGWDVFAQRFDPTGTVVGSEFRVNTTTAQDQVTPAVALDGSGDAVITWASQGQDNGASWGVYGQRYDATGNRVGGEFLVNTTTAGDQQYPSAALDSQGNLVVAWSGNGTGDSSGVFARRFPSPGITAPVPVTLTPPPSTPLPIGPVSAYPPPGTVSTPTPTITAPEANFPQTVTITGGTSAPAPVVAPTAPTAKPSVSHGTVVPAPTFVPSVADFTQVRQASPAVTLIAAPPPAPLTAPPAGADTSVAMNLGGGRNLGLPAPAAAVPVPFDVSAVNLLTTARLSRPTTTLTAVPPESPGAQDAAQAGRAWTGPAQLLVRPPEAPLPVHGERPSLAIPQRSLEDSLLAAGRLEDTAGAVSTVARGEGVLRSRQANAVLPWDVAEQLEEPAEISDPTDGPGPVALTGLAATAGYVLLHTRAAPWLLSLLAARPFWKQLDPLEVLFAWEQREGRGARGAEETLLSLVE
jgi:hypothetical protein